VSSADEGDGEQPYYVREIDDHTGVGDSVGIPYTYEHVDEPPEPEGEVFRVVAWLEPKDRPIHKNVYFVEADRFPQWIEQHDDSLFEQIASVRPVSRDEAEREFTEFGDG
jgi:hypothetical protein